MSFVNKFNEIKLILIESLLEAFPRAEGDEIEAVVTHWLQSPTANIPFLTTSMRDKCWSLVEESTRKRKQVMRVLEHEAPYQASLPIEWADIPFPPPEKSRFRFIDLFAGIGGFRIAMQELGGHCVFSSEWDPYAKKTYEANFGEVPFGDIRKISEEEIPDHEVLCAGFPCQPFSLAGVSARKSLHTAHGFACETQGTLFFDIVRIIKAKQPRIVFLENVRNLVGHDEGKTFSIIKSTIEKLGYSFSYKLIDSSPLVPQRRIRCYMVCIRGGEKGFSFPDIQGPPLPLKSILESEVDESYTISSKLWEGHQRRTNRNLARGTGFTAFCADLEKPSNTIVARYGKDGKECLIPQDRKNPRMLTPRECARLQGFPESFVIPHAKTTSYRQFGNSVAIPVIRKIAEEVVRMLLDSEEGV
jgi:DNA (cytosine-5)-methyltransferase 1